MENSVAFPELGLSFELNRVAFTIFGKDIYWYGLIIALGFLLGYLYISKNAERYGFNQDNVMDGVLICVPLAIIGARLYYVIFSWSAYVENPIDIIKIWEGGLAIYGGVIGAIVGLCIYAKVKNLSLISMCDVAAPAMLIGQGIGRWGNFVNAEAFGENTTLPWAMSINGADGVHPTFFYESLWNLIGVFVLWKMSTKQKFKGQIACGYLAWYGFGRMFIEGLRTDSLYLFSTGLRTSQVLAAITFIIGTTLLIKGLKSNKKFAIDTEINIPSDDNKEETEQ